MDVKNSNGNKKEKRNWKIEVKMDVCRWTIMLMVFLQTDTTANDT